MSSCLRKFIFTNPALFSKVASDGIISRFSHTQKPFDILDEIKKKNNPDAPKLDITNPFEREKIQCILCKYKITPNYKNVQLLSQFQSSYTGRVYGRHITRLCEKQQLKVESEISKAQQAGLMGYVTKAREYLEDPKLFDPEKPIRPHKY